MAVELPAAAVTSGAAPAAPLPLLLLPQLAVLLFDPVDESGAGTTGSDDVPGTTAGDVVLLGE